MDTYRVSLRMPVEYAAARQLAENEYLKTDVYMNLSHSFSRPMMKRRILLSNTDSLGKS